MPCKLAESEIEEIHVDRRSEKRLDGMTVKSSDDRKQVNEGVSFYWFPGLAANSLGSGFVGALLVPEDADNPPALPSWTNWMLLIPRAKGASPAAPRDS